MRMNELGRCFCLMCSITVIRSALRQAGILLREVVKYRESLGLLSWPCFLAGGKSPIYPMLSESFPDDRFSRAPQISTLVLKNRAMLY